jgi:hypothetical protein
LGRRPMQVRVFTPSLTAHASQPSSGELTLATFSPGEKDLMAAAVQLFRLFLPGKVLRRRRTR